MRGARTDSPVRIVNAFAVGTGLSLGQKRIREKTNEIPAVKKLVGKLNIKGCIITADAMHCRKKTCECSIKEGAEFFLFAKGNQEMLRAAVAEAVEVATAHPNNNNDRYSTTDHPDSKN